MRGVGGWIVAPGSIRPDGKVWQTASGAPSLVHAVLTGSIPVLPDWLAQIIRPRTKCADGKALTSRAPSQEGVTSGRQETRGNVTARERAYASGALGNLSKELAAARRTTRNDKLYKSAFRMGAMIGRNWIRRSNVEAALLEACKANGLEADDGADSTKRTLHSGIIGGVERPHRDLGSSKASRTLSERVRNQSWADNKRWSELRALFRLRMGPRPSWNDIVNAIIQASGGYPVELNGHEIGKLVSFTFDEYTTMGREALGRWKARHPSTIRPFDVTEDQIQAYLNMTRKPARATAERQRRARKKEQHRLANEVDCRSSAVYSVLTGTPQSIAALMKKLRRSAAFRSIDGQLSEPSLRRAILRELDKEPLKSMVGVTGAVEKHGKPMKLIRRST